MSKVIRVLFLVLFVLAACACSAKYKHKLDFDPVEPIRVAVLPFYQVNDNGAIVDSEVTLFQIANRPDLQEKVKTPPARIMQRLVMRELETTAFDIIPHAKVRADFVHHKFTKGVTYDYQRIEKTSPKALCELLGCDALIYGKLTEWSQSYYAVQSVNTVGLDLRLVRASDGKVLFASSSEDSDSRGLSKGPTGYASVVLEPLKGLRKSVIEELARNVAQKALAPLKVENRPEFLETARPILYASSHDAASGKFQRKDSLTVVMTGSPGHTASFSIGDVVRNIPMLEVEDGHYLGEFFPLKIDSFESQDVYVSLTDRYRRTTRQRVGLGPVSLN